MARAGALPCVVLAHGFGGLREARLDAFAERFAARGYMALVFDYRRSGASDGEPRQVLSIRGQHQDWTAAIEFARELPGVDPERIVLWGSSLGGGHVMHMAARDPRIAAVIAQMPYGSGLRVLDGKPFGALLQLGWAALRDAGRALLGSSPLYVPILSAPGGLAVMAAPGAEEAARRLYPPGTELREDVAARIFLDLFRYAPAQDAMRIRCPLLVQVGDRDSVNPPDAAERAACRAPFGELIRYPIDHFDIYLGEAFERAVEDQIAFLDRCVPFPAPSRKRR